MMMQGQGTSNPSGQGVKPFGTQWYTRLYEI
jgi:hypothetical protein